MNLSLRRAANIVAVLLLIAVLVPFVVYAVPGVVGADYSFVVLTASMTPAIAPGDVVIVADRGAETVVEGDVITFVRGTNEVPVTHRVTGVVESNDGIAFETKGDANSEPDAGLVDGANVLGTVIFTIPYIGYVVQFTNTPYGFIALVVLPLALLVVSEFWTLYRRRTATATAAATNAEAKKPAEAETSNEAAETGTSQENADDADSATAAASGGFVITNRTLEGSFVPLVGFAVYAGYIAYTWQTSLTIAVAVGSAMTTLVVLVLLVASRRNGQSVPPVQAAEPLPDGEHPATDGGVDADPMETKTEPGQ